MLFALSDPDNTVVHSHRGGQFRSKAKAPASGLRPWDSAVTERTQEHWGAPLLFAFAARHPLAASSRASRWGRTTGTHFARLLI